MQNEDEIRDSILRVVRKRLAPTKVVDVKIQEDVDHDGDNILWVTVLFDGSGSKPDPKKVVGLGRYLRKPLQEKQVNRFPVLTFMTPEEQHNAVG